MFRPCSVMKMVSIKIPTHHCPVEVLELWIVAKSVVNGRYGRSPHQYYHSEVVKLVPKRRNTWTVVGDYVESTPICLGHFIEIYFEVSLQCGE